MTLVKNLGQLQALFISTIPPENIYMLWYDTNTGVNAIKYYDVELDQWRLLGAGGSGGTSQLALLYEGESTGVNQEVFTLAATPLGNVIVFIAGSPQPSSVFNLNADEVTLTGSANMYDEVIIFGII